MKAILEKMVHLARLRLPEKELERFTRKTEHIVEYIEKLKELDTTGMEPTSHATPPPVSRPGGGAIDVVNAFREDTVEKFSNIKKILEMAPKLHDNLFVVPKVIDEA